MKNRRLMLPLMLLLAAVSPAGAYNNGAPTLQCYNCHVPVGEHQTELKVSGLPAAYEPGKTYRITVAVESSWTSTGTVQGGFAAAASAGELAVTDKANTQISDRMVTHTQAGSALRSWTFAWKAPKKKQDVEMTVMATAANGDFAPLGDPVAARMFTIPAKR